MSENLNKPAKGRGRMEIKGKGTMILKREGSFFLKDKGRFFKVITVRPVGDNRYVFDCRELDSKKSEVLTFRLLGLLDAMDAAARVMRDPKDILLVDLDNQGKWKILSKDEVDRISRSQNKSGFGTSF